MTPSADETPTSNGVAHDDDLVPPSPWEVEAWREYERRKIQILSEVATRVDALITDTRKEVAKRVDRDAVLDSRHEWHVKAMATLTDKTTELSTTVAAFVAYASSESTDARGKLDTLSREDAAQDARIALAEERATRLAAEVDAAKQLAEAAKSQAALATKLAAWKWTAIAGAAATGALVAAKALGLIHF